MKKRKNKAIPVELPVIWQSRNKIDLYRKDFYYTDDFEIGFWVTDGEHYQLFCEKIYAPRSFGVEALGRPSHKNDAWYKHFNRAICYKTRELILMYEAWQEKAKYITEVWTKATGGYDVKHYPKPDKWWTVSKLPALEAKQIIESEFGDLKKEDRSQYDTLVALLVKYGADNSRPMDAEVKPEIAEEIIKILNKAAEEINIGQSTTYDGFDITKDRKNFIAKIRKHIRKQLSV